MTIFKRVLDNYLKTLSRMETTKDTFEMDADIFLNLDEFGEMIEIDGVKLAAIVDSYTGGAQDSSAFNANRRINNNIRADFHNINLIGDYMTVRFKTRDYTRERGRIPQNLEFVRINGKRYKVENSQDTAGMTRLDCYADRDKTPRRLPTIGLPALYDE